MTYNYYAATFFVVTARRATIMGVKVWRDYGYYVLIHPRVTNEGRIDGRVRCWCKTKEIANEQAESYRNSQRMGYWGCPCGSGLQKRRCCG